MIRTRTWTEYLGDSEAEALYQMDVEKGAVIGAKIIAFFKDDFGDRHEFVRWDSCHGQFHKHCLYDRKQGRDELSLPAKRAFNEAVADLNANWGRYKSAYVRNHIKRG